MEIATIGTVIIAISILGYISNWLNWHFLNYKINHVLYYFGAFIHETSHAFFCLITGAKIHKYKVFVEQPQVSYSNSKLPIIGNLLISTAPILGGLAFLFFINKYFLSSHYVMPDFSDWRLLVDNTYLFLKQLDFGSSKNLIVVFLFFNMGSMIGPSWQDLKNIWFLMILLIFIKWPFFVSLGLFAVSLIIINIIFQVILIFIIYLLKYIRSLFTVEW